MSLETHSFEFGEFLLDAKEKVLLRGGKPFSVTPKAFEMLCVLVEKHGHLIEKNELMKAVWTDSFVEDGNLTFTIRLLRKALGDDAQNPRFIETVPKRGYRFIAEVTEISVENESKTNTAQAFAQPIEKKFDNSSIFKKFLLPIFAVLVIGAIFGGFWYERSKNTKLSVPILSAPFSSENLSTNGKVYHAVISPDGKNVVYTSGTGGDKQSVWLRELESGNNIELILPSDDFYAGIALSPDGNFLYFSRRTKFVKEQADIYRVSIFGGVPIKTFHLAEKKAEILELAWMPDGKGITYISANNKLENNILSVQPLDGKMSRQIAALDDEKTSEVTGFAIAPDGKSFAVVQGGWKHDAVLLRGLK